MIKKYVVVGKAKRVLNRNGRISISINIEAFKALAYEGRFGESYSDLIIRLANHKVGSNDE